MLCVLSPGRRLLRTVYYWTLVLGQVAAAFACTTKRQPLFGNGAALNGLSLSLSVFVCLSVCLLVRRAELAACT